MEVYKRNIDLNTLAQSRFTSSATTSTIQIFLTQTIEDIGIYEDDVEAAHTPITATLMNNS